MKLIKKDELRELFTKVENLDESIWFFHRYGTLENPKKYPKNTNYFVLMLENTFCQFKFIHGINSINYMKCYTLSHGQTKRTSFDFSDINSLYIFLRSLIETDNEQSTTDTNQGN